MKIGQFVQRHIRDIFEYCEARDPAEFSRLQDKDYSKKTFDINYPFCTAVEKLVMKRAGFLILILMSVLVA